MSKKVVFFLPSLYGGGGERIMVNLANGFTEKGYPVDLVLAKAEGPYLAEVSDGVRIIDLHASRVIAAVSGLARHLRVVMPSAVLSNQSHANLVAILAGRQAAVSSRIVVREGNTASISSANAPTLRGRIMPFLIRWFYPLADRIIAPSQGVLNDLCRNFHISHDKLCLIYNPTVSSELIVKADDPLDHPWFGPGQPPVVLGVGRLTRQKDFATLIRAFAKIGQQKPSRLVILGEGEGRGMLEAIVRESGVEERVLLPGFVANPFNYMKRSALFVLSSVWEGMPNVLIQAMACGVPVVSTDCPSGPAEILENGKYGTLVPVGNVDALSRGIMAALEKGNDADFSHSRICKAMDFSVDKIVKQYMEVLLPTKNTNSTRSAITSYT